MGYQLANDELGQSLLETTSKIDAQTDRIQNLKTSYDETIVSINDNKEASLLEIETVKEQAKELENLIDTNGRVKEGYEERVSVILGDLNEALGTEYTLTGNQITQNGKLYTSYSDLMDNIDAYIEKRKEQIEAEAYEDIYKEKIKYRLQLEKELGEAYDNRIEAEKGLEDAMKATNSASSMWEKQEAKRNEIIAKSNLDKAIKEEQDLQQELDNTQNTLDEMSDKYTETYNKIYDTAENTGQKTSQFLRDNIVEQNNIAQEGSETIGTTFKNMGVQSREYYSQGISQITQDTEDIITKTQNSVKSFSPELIQEWANLAKNNKSAYENNLTGLDSTTSQRIQSCVDAINNKKWTAEETAKGLAIAVENGVNTIDTTEAGRQAVNGVTKGINNNKNNKSLWSAISGLVTNVKNWFKNLFGIHSPSRVMADLAQYIPLGIAEGIKENTSTAVNQAKTMAEDVSNAVTNNIDTDTFGTLKNGIEVNTKDFAVDTNEYVDYSAIRGQVEARSNMTIDSNIIQGIAHAVRQALSETQVNVNIEAKADEGVIVKKASEGFTNYVMQTGELPFPIPV